MLDTKPHQRLLLPDHSYRSVRLLRAQAAAAGTYISHAENVTCLILCLHALPAATHLKYTCKTSLPIYLPRLVCTCLSDAGTAKKPTLFTYTLVRTCLHDVGARNEIRLYLLIVLSEHVSVTYAPAIKKRQRGDSNPCGQSPMDF